MKRFEPISELYHDISGNKLRFFLSFFVIVLLSYSVLFAIDFIPEPISAESKAKASALSEVKASVKSIINRINGGLVVENNSDNVAEEPAKTGTMRVVIPEEKEAPVVNVNVDPNPKKIIFDSLDNKTVTVLNPTSRAIADLDEALLSGVVRHPDSADFVNTGNIFILGHSSYLPTVFNKNFQAFNEIQSLTWGDTIRLQSGDTEYVYQVDRVYKASANTLEVPNSRGTAKLTLATCNSFGSKDDRFIVEASLVSQRAL
jgi:LPXTG-site transpeptidase (sortase) family protein